MKVDYKQLFEIVAFICLILTIITILCLFVDTLLSINIYPQSEFKNITINLSKVLNSYQT